MTNLRVFALSLFTGLALCGCAAAVKPDLSGQVGRNELPPEPSTRMALASNQIFMPGELITTDLMPVYPSALLPLQLPDQAVCVRFMVGVDGSVSNVVPVYGIADCPADAQALRPEFLGATLAAVSHWDFYSSLRCTFPPGTPDIDKCNGPGSTAEQVR